MPITLNKIANDTASVTINVGEDTCTIEYYPSRITEKTFKQLQQFQNVNNDTIESGFESFNEVLSSLIKAWDVYEDDQQTILYPTTPDRLSELPIPFRSQVLQAIMEDMRPNSEAPTT